MLLPAFQSRIGRGMADAAVVRIATIDRHVAGGSGDRSLPRDDRPDGPDGRSIVLWTSVGGRKPILSPAPCTSWRTAFSILDYSLVRLSGWFPRLNRARQRAAEAEIARYFAEACRRQRRAAAREWGSRPLGSAFWPATDGDGQATPLTDAEVLAEARTMFFAGHHTAAACLTWTLHLLALHPHIRQRLVDEIARRSRRPRGHHRRHAPAHLHDTGHSGIDAALSARLGAVRPGGAEPVEIGSYTIPQGAWVFIYPWVLHRDARVFPDPLTFNPDRFSPGVREAIPDGSYIPVRIRTSQLHRWPDRDDRLAGGVAVAAPAVYVRPGPQSAAGRIARRQFRCVPSATFACAWAPLRRAASAAEPWLGLGSCGPTALGSGSRQTSGEPHCSRTLASSATRARVGPIAFRSRAVGTTFRAAPRTIAAFSHPLDHLPQFDLIQHAVAIGIDAIKLLLEHGRRFVLGQLAVAVGVGLFETGLEFVGTESPAQARTTIAGATLSGPRLAWPITWSPSPGRPSPGRSRDGPSGEPNISSRVSLPSSLRSSVSRRLLGRFDLAGRQFAIAICIEGHNQPGTALLHGQDHESAELLLVGGLHALSLEELSEPIASIGGTSSAATLPSLLASVSSNTSSHRRASGGLPTPPSGRGGGIGRITGAALTYSSSLTDPSLLAS